MNRRGFIKHALKLTAAPAAFSAIQSCKPGDPYGHITGKIVGANHKAGHILRDKNFAIAPDSSLHTDVLIVGGGITGLSAMRWLNLHGTEDVTMVEMDTRVGGNSACDQNPVSAYPWGAHYLPIPYAANKELISFLQSINVIRGFNEHGLPIYNEYHLCHEPEERLYINGHWQEGLVPQFGVSSKDKHQINRFFQYIETLKHARGKDNKYAFSIPIDASSTDEDYRALDKVSFATFLQQQGYTSPYLLWYLEYCCKDDYGATLEQTSAWAGLHYFASRKGVGANANSSDVLTWPEGNGYLMNGLRKQCKGRILVNTIVAKIEQNNDTVAVYCLDTQTQKCTCIYARKILLATPQYVNRRILAPSGGSRDDIYSAVNYAPWVVANITFSGLPQGRGVPLSWDNVIYDQPSVGYVYANHQQLHHNGNGVITHYLPITGDPKKTRGEIYGHDYKHWQARILKELNFAHPGIAEHVDHMDIWIWGHGMIMPRPNYIWSAERQLAMQNIDNRIFFAHSDLSGISIFEEAFYQGIRAAKEIKNSL